MGAEILNSAPWWRTWPSPAIGRERSGFTRKPRPRGCRAASGSGRTRPEPPSGEILAERSPLSPSPLPGGDHGAIGEKSGGGAAKEFGREWKVSPSQPPRPVFRTLPKRRAQNLDFGDRFSGSALRGPLGVSMARRKSTVSGDAGSHKPLHWPPLHVRRQSDVP